MGDIIETMIFGRTQHVMIRKQFIPKISEKNCNE